MISPSPITLGTAAQLLDFAGGSEAAKSYSKSQLEGAVALHNILARGRVAYLADEVGMGKTYVVLGTLGLLRHYCPGLRVLYIVPRANLQRKWRKEIRNFTLNNWQQVDHRVKTFQGSPVVQPVMCENLVDLVRETALNSNRDFILRMTSFSLPLSEREGGGKAWQDKADALRQAFPGLAEAALAIDGRSPDAQERFKDVFAATVNALLPHFDFLVLDEGHNLKHGFAAGQGATRNRLLAYVLGTKSAPSHCAPLIRRIDRAIILSATPVDGSFEDLWNQLDLLGLADGYEELRDKEADDEKKKLCASQCLIRRLTKIEIGGKWHTRNMYRREWRGGGVGKHDEPLDVPNGLQRLIVALMQKKVADVLAEQGRGRQKRFSRSFQIGMLASFESFSRTATRRDPNFDQEDQTKNSGERLGIDTDAVNEVARTYRDIFGDSPPHPKMNAVVDEIWNAFLEARKTLVFVRRIHSVPEMVEKLTRRYNDWIEGRIREELRDLPQADQSRLANAFDRYRQQRKEFYSGNVAASFSGGQVRANEGDATDRAKSTEESEPGGFESFFSWFFRGKGPGGLLSGASFSKNRLENESAQLSTFFDDNWMLWLLNYPADPLGELEKLTGTGRSQVISELRARAAALHIQKKTAKRQVFYAYQQAALEMVAAQTSDAELSQKAKAILERRQREQPKASAAAARPRFPGPERFLGLKTFFTELAQKTELCQLLWPPSNAKTFGEAFVEREQRRLLLSSVIRLGHPMVDLWLLQVKAAGTLAAGKLEEADSAEEQIADAGVPADERLALEFVNLLDRQRSMIGQHPGPTSFLELRRLATDFQLLVAVNFHEMRERPLAEVPDYIADRIGQQQPIAGMHGGVLRRTVSQFRMPGYPYVLVTTDVLQEGEDLHTYCDRIVHYGISWTPSAIEQRTGRVDRIGSLVQRRMEALAGAAPSDGDYLQVYYPYLGDTYEYVQVGVVFKRLNRFLEMLHDLRLPHRGHAGEVQVAHQIHEKAEDVFKPFREPLKSGFEIAPEFIPIGPVLTILQPLNDQLLEHFRAIASRLTKRFSIEWNNPDSSLHQCRGTVFVQEGRLLAPNETDLKREAREQPFSMELRTTHAGKLLLRIKSRLGAVRGEPLVSTVFELQRKKPWLKICAVLDEGSEYRLSVQSDLLFSPVTTQPEEVERVFARVLAGADEMENAIVGRESVAAGELDGENAEDTDDGSD